MVQCFIGMGSNLGASHEIFHSVLEELRQHPSLTDIVVSSFYRTKPLDNADQPDYLNAVVGFKTSLEPELLLDQLQNLERKYGRVRSGVRWESRTLDLDILLYGSQMIESERLTVPHQAMPSRDFVLIPLFEIAPQLEIPGHGNIENLVAKCQNRGMEKEMI